jgi:hypothetical protein
MRFKKTRIAISIVCGTLCLFLIGLWVRSYRQTDVLCISLHVGRVRATVIESVSGRVMAFAGPFSFHHRDSWPSDRNSPWFLLHESIFESLDRRFFELPDPDAVHGFQIFDSPSGFHLISLPNWFLAAHFATFAIIPWIRWSKRYSLRTLLIATTAVAIGLWFIVWMSRK